MLKNALLILVSFAAALLVAEGVLRLFDTEPLPGVVPDPVLKFRNLDPSWDERGWNNDAALPQAEIVALGDSMTQGQGVVSRDDAWPGVLAELSGASVYQMALGGYGPVQYAALLEDALALSPKVVVVGFYFGNDVFDAYDAAYHLDHWKEIRDPSFVDPNEVARGDAIDPRIRMEALAGAKEGTLRYRVFTGRLWIRNNVRLYALLGDATRALRVKLGLAQSQLENAADLSRLDPNSVFVYDKDPRIATVLSPQYRLEAVDLSASTTREGWRIAKDRFRAIRDALGTSTELVVIEIPTKEAVYLDLMAKAGAVPDEFVSYKEKEDALEGAFREFCEKENFRCHSLRPALLAALEEGRPAYKPVIDGHPREVGYRVFAESIYDYLTKEGLLPERP